MEKNLKNLKKQELKRYWKKLSDLLYEMNKSIYVSSRKGGIETLTSEKIANVVLRYKATEKTKEGIDWEYAEKIWNAESIESAEKIERDRWNEDFDINRVIEIRIEVI
jgi:hypothetical protein